MTGGRLWDEPHHDGSPLHGPGRVGAALGDEVDVLLQVPHGGSGSSTASTLRVHLRQVHDGEPTYGAAVVDHVDDHDVWFRAGLTVRNRLTRYRWLLDDSASGSGYVWLNAAGVHRHDVTDASDFVVSTYAPAPDWAVDGVVYQVFPDRFARSGVDHGPPPRWAVPATWDDPVVHDGPGTPLQLFGGDLAGIAQHLDHLVDLGVDVLYLTPFFPAASNHRYNGSSFDVVDPLLGGDAALEALIAAAHSAGLRVIGDLTTNHTGDDHDWFVRAQADAGSAEAGFYYFTEHPDGYEAWFGLASLPKLNHGSTALRRRLVDGADSVVARWLATPEAPDGLDGWRIDVANMTGRKEGDEHTHEVARLVRRTMDATQPETFLLAEHFHDSSDDVTTGAGGWDSVMNYSAFTRPVWEWLAPADSPYKGLGMPVLVPRRTTVDVVASMRLFAAAVPWQQTLQNVNLLGSHDTPRALSVVGDEASLLVGVSMLVGYPGIPMVFAGDELALRGDDGEHARTPMPWGDGARFGSDLHEGYRQLLSLRRAHEALRRGGMRWLDIGDEHMVWLRETPDERIAVVVARGAAVVDLPVSLAGVAERLWTSAAVGVEPGSSTVRISLTGAGAAFLRC